MNIKKTLILTLTSLLFLTSTSICKGDFGVHPRELSITMGNEFLNGNTLRYITVQNGNYYDINISWYIDHPVPISDMRPNKTLIPDLSWINVKPQWQIISPNSSTAFYIYLDIPENEENLDQHWETWITFKREKKQFINIENAVRLYINTPIELINNDNQGSDSLSIATGDQINIPLIDFIIAAVIATLIIIGFLLIRKKKS